MDWPLVWEWTRAIVVFGVLPLGLAALAVALWREGRRGEERLQRRERELAVVRGGFLRFSGEMLERHLQSWEALQREGSEALAAERGEVLRELDRRVEDFRERLRALEGELEFLATRTRSAVERLWDGRVERARRLALSDQAALRDIARGLLTASAESGTGTPPGPPGPGEKPENGSLQAG
ncbi:MAG: hypothetical protein ACE5JJ_01465 [Nitrospinota bacterium]